MNAILDNHTGPRLADVYPPFGEKMREFQRLAERDMRAAEKAFAEAQEMAKAFYAGVEFARGAL